MNTLLPKPKKRYPIIAGFLTLLVPGLGQMYNGQIKKGAIIYSVFLLGLITLIATRSITSYYGLWTLIIFPGIIYLYAFLDAIITASKLIQFYPRTYNIFFFYFLIIVSGIFLNIIIFNDGFLGFRMVTMNGVANEPQIKHGNKIFIDEKAYDNSPIQRGDLVAFKNPQDTQMVWILRVIALPNDTVKINNFHPHVGYEIPQIKYIKDTTIGEYTLQMTSEQWHNGKSYCTLTQNQDTMYKNGNYPAMMIPEGHYYLLGDHRTQAFDSRFIGPIPSANIIGKAKFIYQNQHKNQSKDIQ